MKMLYLKPNLSIFNAAQDIIVNILEKVGSMGAFSIWHWVIVLVVVLILFGGRGKLSQLMGDMAKGITAFKKGLEDENVVETVGDPKVLNATSPNEAPEATNEARN